MLANADKTVAHPDPNAPAWIINDGHDDTHYAKLAERMGNYTEAWLHHKGHKKYIPYRQEWKVEGQSRSVC